MKITVWSKKPCVQCNAVYRALDGAGLKGKYEVINLPDFPDQLAAFKDRGLMQAPIVEAEGFETFAGYDPDAIKAIIAKATAQ